MSALFKTSVCGAAIAAVGIAAALPASAATAQPRATLDAAPSWTASAKTTGNASSSQQLRMSVTLNLRNAAGAEALAKAVSTPGNKSYRHFVTAAAWRQQFAPTSATVKTVTDWLKSNGFSIGAIPSNNRTIAFTGTAAQADKAFGTTLKVYSHDGTTSIAPSKAVTVPSSLKGLVAGIGGLDTSAKAVPMNAGARKVVAPKQTVQTKVTPKDQLPPPPDVFLNAPPCSSYYGQKTPKGVPALKGLKNPLTTVVCGYTPGQLRGAYDTQSDLNKGLDGRGATIAIIDAYAAPTIYNDAATYAQRNDPSHPMRSYQFRQVLPASYTDTAPEDCDASGWYGEETLDVEAAHAMAPGANIVYVGGVSCNDDDLLAALNTVVDNQLAQVVSNSYGDLGEVPFADVAGDHQTYLQAAAEGISIMFSSGDNGDEADTLGMRQPDATGNDPLVTAVGGTALAVGASNNYMWEQGWGTGTASLNAKGTAWSSPEWLYGGGGGESNVFARPWYQDGVVSNAIAKQTVSGKPGRTVPDVAMVGDPQTGFLVGETQAFPNGTYKYSEFRIGGTSLSSPLFAGVTADANQAAGGQLGFLNPLLYSGYGTPVFTDVNHARKVTDAVVRYNYADSTNPKSAISPVLRTINDTESIYLRKGYDDVTGLGTPVGSVLFGALMPSNKH